MFGWFKKFFIKDRTCIDFKAGIDLTNLPIVTFNQGSIKLNFLLDTGSTDCIINKSITDNLQKEVVKENMTVYGIEGNRIDNTVIKLPIQYKETTYLCHFIVMDLDKTFSNIKEESGVILHGIIGNSFFVKNKSILDYEEMKAYFRK